VAIFVPITLQEANAFRHGATSLPKGAAAARAVINKIVDQFYLFAAIVWISDHQKVCGGSFFRFAI
jgi:hypothetical protein